jgi:UDP-N-acetylglucosamine:LPS N-acetylglucosamine transferase
MADGMSGPGDRKRRIHLVFFDAGGGHRNAATALQVQIEKLALPLDVTLVNLQEVLDPLDILRKLTGIRIQDMYNKMLRHGWTLGSPQLMRVLQVVVRTYHGPSVKVLEKFWKEHSPDMVVSLVPHFNRALQESYAKTFTGRPFVTVLTDLADYPKHFWIEKESQYIVCGTEHAVEQARDLGHMDGTVFRTSGMILHPRFYEPISLDRVAERKKLGLDPDLTTGIVLFGGYGTSKMQRILRKINESSLAVQLILICGRNEKLAEALRHEPSRIPIHVEGFTTQIPYFMALSDFFIGKPGPGSISEALAKHLPVIIDCNAWTLPQERYNAQWVREKQVGIVVKSHRHTAAAVAELLKPGELAQFRARTEAMENRAIFEIPVIFEKILNGGPEKVLAGSEAGNFKSQI